MEAFFSEKKVGSFIGSEYILSGKSRPHISPVNSQTLIELIYADGSTVQQALRNTEIAQEKLRMTTAYDRSKALRKIGDLLLQNKEHYANIITLEMGKTINDSRAEIDYTAGYFFWFAEEAKRIYDVGIPSRTKEKRIYLRYEPIGPCAIITPWNYPLAMAGRKIAPAIAAGCSVICRPSSSTPLSLLLLGLLVNKTDLPSGSVQILISETKMAEELLTSPAIRKLSFTGSDTVGKHLYELCSKTIKKVTMELGGHAPVIIFDDAYLENAADEVIIAKFRNSGQTCICANRIYVQQNVVDAFVHILEEKVRQLKIGDPLDESTDLTTVLHPTSTEKVRRQLEDAKKKGASFHLGAKNPYDPEILTQVTDDMLIFQEETFGPIAAISAFSDEAEAMKLANQTKYGLASYVFTESIGRAEYALQHLKFGIVGLNDGRPSAPEVPFGGMKNSGFGREGGPTGIYEYLIEKAVSQKIV